MTKSQLKETAKDHLVWVLESEVKTHLALLKLSSDKEDVYYHLAVIRNVRAMLPRIGRSLSDDLCQSITIFSSRD